MFNDMPVKPDAFVTLVLKGVPQEPFNSAVSALRLANGFLTLSGLRRHEHKWSVPRVRLIGRRVSERWFWTGQGEGGAEGGPDPPPPLNRTVFLPSVALERFCYFCCYYFLFFIVFLHLCLWIC